VSASAVRTVCQSYYLYEWRSNIVHVSLKSIHVHSKGPSAMGLLHGLLAQNSNGRSSHIRDDMRSKASICLIESGGSNADTYSKDWAKTAFEPRYVSVLSSVPQRGLNSRIVDVPVGSGLGGGSNINACLFVPPDFENDFQEWPEPYKSGKIIKEAAEYLASFMAENGGVEDYDTRCNIEFNDVVGRKDVPSNLYTERKLRLTTKRDGKRVNYFDSLVRPLLSSNVIIRENTSAERLLWDHHTKTATGVVCFERFSKKRFIISAKKEIILCAGAIFSPVLLLKSGIGNEDKLKVMKSVKKIHHLPGVGQNLKDHLLIPRLFLSPSLKGSRRSMNGVRSIFKDSCRGIGSNDVMQKPTFEFLLMDGTGLENVAPRMVSNIFRRGFFDNTHINFDENQFQKLRRALLFSMQTLFKFVYLISFTLLQVVFHYIEPIPYLCKYHMVTLLIAHLNPKSRGAVIMSSDDTFEINPAYMTNSTDETSIIEAWKRSEDLKNDYFTNCYEIFPGKFYTLLSLISNLCQNSNQLHTNEVIPFFKDFSMPYFHWIGTCAMSKIMDKGKLTTTNNSVVDSNFQVIGMHNIRVCDASVFVTCISAPTALTCASLGYILSSIFNQCN